VANTEDFEDHYQEVKNMGGCTLCSSKEPWRDVRGSSSCRYRGIYFAPAESPVSHL
jgi:hypothetical protein